MREIDPETLAKSNGKEGNPVYIAYKGKVIDVSNSRLWKTGLHMGRHAAGADLTAHLSAAPHGPEVLERYPQIGSLQSPEPVGREMPAFLAMLLERYPILRRHVHPAAVHFPIAFMGGVTGFYLIHFFTGKASFETTAVHCLAAGIIFSFLGIITGFITWWLNYMARPMRQVTIKIILSCVMLVDGIAALLWRLYDPGFAKTFSHQLDAYSLLYTLLVLALGPLAIAIGYFGGTLTFPLDKK